MADIFSEVDDIMRQERIEKFFKEHGRFVLAFVAVVILGTAFVSGYNAWNNSVNKTQTDKLLTLLEDATFPDNIKSAELDMRGGLKGIALLTAAGTFLENGKTEAALSLYTQAAGDKSIPDDLRQLAILTTVRLETSGRGTEETSNTDLQARLETVWKDTGSPWRYHAHLEAAALYAHQDQDFTKSKEHLRKILETKNLPDTLYAKAQALNHIYGLKQQEAEKQVEKDSDS